MGSFCIAFVGKILQLGGTFLSHPARGTYNKVSSIIRTIIIRTVPQRSSYGVCAIDRVTKVNWQVSAMLNSDIVVIKSKRKIKNVNMT